MTSVGISWIVLSWQQYSGTQEVVQQEVYVVRGGERRVLVVPGVERMVNVTGLEPGTEYTFNIRSEGADGQKSLLSESITAFTLIPGRANVHVLLYTSMQYHPAKSIQYVEVYNKQSL